MRYPIVALGLIALALPAGAQGGTDVWVASFQDLAGRITVGGPVNVTARPGYDNQPAFTADGRAVLFTSIREDAQADIWRVAAEGGSHAKVTDTPESEYSATLTPDGLALSVIRVERDSTQRLWRFPLDGGTPSLVLRALRPVGYHVWVGDHTLGTFVLGQQGQPNALVLADARTERADTLARNIGRAFARVPGRDAFTFVQHGATRGDTSWVVAVDVRTRTLERVAPLPPGGEYHLWTASGALVASAGTRLWLRVGDRWDVVADFAELGVRGITRLALSPRGDRIAFVADDPGPR
jgi:hypothetical protein